MIYSTVGDEFYNDLVELNDCKYILFYCHDTHWQYCIYTVI
jgi:hypothetical protein